VVGGPAYPPYPVIPHWLDPKHARSRWYVVDREEEDLLGLRAVDPEEIRLTAVVTCVVRRM
jgi:hypothetical protein